MKRTPNWRLTLNGAICKNCGWSGGSRMRASFKHCPKLDGEPVNTKHLRKLDEAIDDKIYERCY